MRLPHPMRKHPWLQRLRQKKVAEKALQPPKQTPPTPYELVRIPKTTYSVPLPEKNYPHFAPTTSDSTPQRRFTRLNHERPAHPLLPKQTQGQAYPPLPLSTLLLPETSREGWDTIPLL